MHTTQLSQTAQFDKMTKTPIPKLVMQLGIPTTISMLVTNIYNMADTWFVGRVGISASGAVGIVFGLMAIIQAFGFMFGHGAGSIISRRLGAHDVDSASRFATTSFFCSFGAGLLITVGGLVFMDPLLRLLGSTDTILPYARQYALFILLGAPFMASSCVLNNILRYEGQAAFAMIGLTSGGILNIFGDWILMEGFHLGVLGAGISTGVSQLISFGLLFYMFLAGHTQSKIAPRNMTRDMADVLLICRTGLPSLMRQGLGSVSTMLLNGQARLYGDAAVAAMSIVNRIAQFIFSFGLGVGQGFQPVSAFNYGAKRYDRVRQAFLFTFAVSEVLMGSIAALGFFFCPELIALFQPAEDVVRIGASALTLQLGALFFQPLTVCSNMLFQSIGQNRTATLLSSLRSGLLFIPALLVLSTALGMTGVTMAQPVADVLAFFIALPFVIRFFVVLRQMPSQAADQG